MEKHLEEKFLKYYNQDLFAKTASAVLYDFAKEGTLKNLTEARETLLKKYNHNVVVKNATKYFLYKINPKKIKQEGRKKHQEIIKHLETANKRLAMLASKKIKTGSTVFVHSLNNHLVDTLLEAGKHKNFRVNIIDHAPFSLGEAATKKLKKEGVEIKLFPDVALHQAIKEADVCLIGGEAILKKGAIAKHGAKLVAEQAKKQQTTTYVCAHSWKYAPDKINSLLEHEHEHGHHDHKKVYEYLTQEEFYAFVCEYGIFKPEHIVNEILFHNKWMTI